MHRALLILCLLFLLPQLLCAQQTLRGSVQDAETGQPLVETLLLLRQKEQTWQTTSDTLGRFRFEALAPGYYQLELRYLGYEPLLLTEVLLESGKESVLNLELLPQASQLERVTVTASRQQLLHPVSVRSISPDETQRFPAVFLDPARQMSAYAGVVAANEQANHLSVRGNAPTSLAWYLEGVEIVNPNHLSNAGTFSDRASGSGGGVNMLSAQLLDYSQFWSGAFPAEYGNVLGAVMDMRLRPGNREQREYTAQIGLLGIDLAAEGPLRSENDASYLVNYRYSTLGLLSAMGVTLGDEDIQFQDLAFHLDLPQGRKGGSWRLFGMGGMYQNFFETIDPQPTDDIERIRFQGQMAALGLRHQRTLNERTRVSTSLVWSGLTSERSFSQFRQSDNFMLQFSDDRNTESRLGLLSTLDHRFSLRARLRSGLRLTALSTQLESSEFATSSEPVQGLLLQPFAQLHYSLSNAFDGVAGVHVQYFSYGSDYSVEPRLSLRWQLAPAHRLSLASGLHSQIQAPVLYHRYGALDFTRALHSVLGYQWQLGQALSLQAEMYYQHLYRVPASETESFSAINLLDNFWPGSIALQNIGQGNNYGLELSLQRHLVRGWYFLANGALFRSNFRAGDELLRVTRFDARHAGNLVAGREFSWMRGTKARTMGLNLRAVYVGGLPVQPGAFEETSQARHPAMYRLDFRLYWKWQPAARTHLLSIDLLNATNRVLEIDDQYHGVGPSLPLRVQTGLIPMLTYRLQWGKR